jgi:hypothetical protein
LDRFLWLVTGEPYHSLLFGLEADAVPGRISSWAGLLGDQFGWHGLAICLIGAWGWWRRDRRFALFGLIWMLLFGVYAFFYNTSDAHVYLIPVFLLLALGWAEGVRLLLHWVRHAGQGWQRLALAIIVTLPFLSLALHWRAADLSEEVSAHAYMRRSLEAAAPGGLVIVRGDAPTFALWYGVYGEGQRPDLAVVNGPLLAYDWYRDNLRHLYPYLIVHEPADVNAASDDIVQELILQNLAQRPVYATDPSDSWKMRFGFVPVGDSPLYGVYLQPK